MQATETIDLESLAKVRSEQGPVFSLYLDLRAGQAPLERFEQLLAAAEQERKLDQDLPEYRQRWQQEAQRVREWLTKEQESKALAAPHVLGLAVISCQEAGLWHALHLPAPIADRLVARDLAHIRPLEILQAEYDHTLLALIDEGTARLVEVYLGQAEDVARVQAVPVTGAASAESTRLFAQTAAERAQAAWQKRDYDRLLIGGSGEPLSALREALPGELREGLAGELQLTPQAEKNEILAQVTQIESDLEWRQEAQRVEALLANADEAGVVLGLEQTLLAVRSKKIRLLLVEEDFHRSGGECPNCGFLGEGAQQPCLLCGMALRPKADIVEVALKRVLEQGGQIDVLRSPSTRRALVEHGHIGALLRDREWPPETKTMSNRRKISDKGVVNPEALQDEKVEESFPASDPPASW